MTYEELLNKLMAGNWQRIERDDRLLDIFPTEDREKGVELWELQRDNETLLLRVRLPFTDAALKLYTLASAQLQHLLQRNCACDLSSFEETASGADTAGYL